MAKPYRLWKRGEVYYYLLRGSKNWKTTEQRTENNAIEFILNQVRVAGIPLDVRTDTTVREYLKPFYTDSCPHVLRLRAENKSITGTHIASCRSLIDNKILTDPVADRKIHKLRRGEVLDFRARLLAKNGPRTVNRTIGVLKTAIKEGIFREELYRDPTAGVGNINYEMKESGVFTKEELRALFPSDGLGPWKDRDSYVAFLIAATCGLRRGETLALCWKHIDFDKMQIRIEQAWKNENILGKPKWQKIRRTPLPRQTAKALKTLRSESLHVLPDSFVFCNDEGRRLNLCWFTERFHAAMKKIGIDTKIRNLTPHSFRHSLNTLLRDAGYSDSKIRAALGWSKEQIQDIYTHFDIDHLRGQADIVDGLFKS